MTTTEEGDGALRRRKRIVKNPHKVLPQVSQSFFVLFTFFFSHLSSVISIERLVHHTFIILLRSFWRLVSVLGASFVRAA